MVAHDAVDPLVVKYLPPLPVWLGRASTVDQTSPLAVVESAFKYWPLVPTARRIAVSAALAAIKSPFASKITAWIAEAAAAAELAALVALVAADDAEVDAELAEVKADDADVLALDAEVAADVALVAALEADVAALLAEV